MSKVPVKAIFGHFLTFSTEGKVAFTHTFSKIFTGSPKFSRTHFWIFSRMDFLFHGKRIAKFCQFSRKRIFSQVQKKVNFVKFHGKSKLYFSRTHVPIFTYVIWKKFSRTLQVFHGQFFRIFSRKEKIFHGWKSENLQKFSRKTFWFSREKKKRWDLWSHLGSQYDLFLSYTFS